MGVLSCSRAKTSGVSLLSILQMNYPHFFEGNIHALNTVVRPNGDDEPINTLAGDGDMNYRKSASRDDSWVDNNGREKTFPFY